MLGKCPVCGQKVPLKFRNGNPNNEMVVREHIPELKGENQNKFLKLENCKGSSLPPVD